ncbi:hypothetical protein [Alicyclobacillus sp. SO9]|uniref:hypothetical protein n=1 Tax=Alicyclobacillus sp. SO9 TaxID=2665646 RepID=UPI0018E78095|nr:hypothetical protein [Alicyclobacillus sp. SO9]QQE80837.1 hypothetical protein GI364_10900 [Alicyclobacillus sp. SO9]
MTWIAAVFTVFTVVYWIAVKPKRKLQDWLVELSLLGLALVFSSMVSLRLWSSVDLLWPIKAVFMPLTEWLYQAV